VGQPYPQGRQRREVARGDIEYVFSENTSNNDYERVMREYSEAGHDLIIGEVFAVEDAARQVAADYPETAYLMGSSFLPKDDAPNFAVFDNYIQDASYLSGIIAGAMTKSNNIGMVGGFPIPEVNRLMHAFMAGVREMRPPGRHLPGCSFIGSWFDPPKAKETAFAHDRRTVLTCFTPSALASPMQRKERGILAIGNVIDTQARIPRHRGRVRDLAFRADIRSGGARQMVKPTAASKPPTMASIPS
jgi:basic membrane protein A